MHDRDRMQQFLLENSCMFFKRGKDNFEGNFIAYFCTNGYILADTLFPMHRYKRYIVKLEKNGIV